MQLIEQTKSHKELLNKHKANAKNKEGSRYSSSTFRTLSTWGVINGFDRAVAKMNACFSNMLYEL